jgi:hypothetical protein
MPKKPVILCKHCGRRIHQIGKKHRRVKYGILQGTWIHYPFDFSIYEFLTCQIQPTGSRIVYAEPKENPECQTSNSVNTPSA